MAEIGIDLGTTNSSVAYLRNVPEIIENEGSPMTPSVVAWNEDDHELLVGQSAKNQALIYPSVISVKRHMGENKTFMLGEKAYTPVDISSMILGSLKKAAEERLGEPAESAVITIPAYFSTAMNEATRQAGIKAGFKSVRLLAEPVAASLAYGAEDLILVYDLGGGTFDVAVIDCFDSKMLGIAGDNHLGGDDFDSRLISHLARELKLKFGVELTASKQGMQMAKDECEKAKKELSRRSSAHINFNQMIDGKPVSLNLRITREEFEEMIKDLIDRTIETVDKAIAHAHEKDKSVDKGAIETVLLVGGSTYIPLVQRMLTEYFGKEPSKQVNPDLAVALGAAVYTPIGPSPKELHKIRLSRVPLVTADKTLKVTGRTTPGATLEVDGAATPANGVATNEGKFALSIELRADTINEVVVKAKDAKGDVRRGGFNIRHETGFSGKPEEPRGPGRVMPLTPRSLGVRVTGEDDRMGVVIPAQKEIPIEAVNRDFGMRSASDKLPGVLQMDIYEGEIPYAPLNTQLGTLTIRCPPLPDGTPLEIRFRVTEDHLLYASVLIIPDPSLKAEATIKCESPIGDRLNVLERTDRVLNAHSEKMRPEEKAKLRKLKQALLDVCGVYQRDSNKDSYERIKKVGLELRGELERIERTGSS